MQALRGWNSDSAWWHASYVVDWVGAVALTAVIWAAAKYSRPWCSKDFDITDPAIGHAFSHSTTFPSWTLPFIAWMAPVVWCVLLEIGCRRFNVPRYTAVPQSPGSADPEAQEGAVAPRSNVPLRHSLHAILLSVAQGTMFAMCVTDPLKNYAGRMRPDYVSRLEQFGHFDVKNFTAAEAARVCASDDAHVMDGRRSFPSGHSSITFGGWTVAALFTYAKLANQEPPGSILRSGVTVFAAMGATFILPAAVAVSRTRDFRHNFSDVLAGSVLGAMVGALAFRLHFSLNSPAPRNRKRERQADPPVPPDDDDPPARSRGSSLSQALAPVEQQATAAA